FISFCNAGINVVVPAHSASEDARKRAYAGDPYSRIGGYRSPLSRGRQSVGLARFGAVSRARRDGGTRTVEPSRRQREDVDAGLGHREGVFELGGERAVARHRGPAVG